MTLAPSALLAPVIKAVFPTSCSAVYHRLFLPPLFMPQSTIVIDERLVNT